jgi:hypothetical protein
MDRLPIHEEMDTEIDNEFDDGYDSLSSQDDPLTMTEYNEDFEIDSENNPPLPMSVEGRLQIEGLSKNLTSMQKGKILTVSQIN